MSRTRHLNPNTILKSSTVDKREGDFKISLSSVSLRDSGRFWISVRPQFKEKIRKPHRNRDSFSGHDRDHVTRPLGGGMRSPSVKRRVVNTKGTRCGRCQSPA